MNEALQAALAALIEKLTTTVTTVSDQVADQIPALVNQMIGFQIMKYWIWIGVEAVVFLTFPFAIYWSIGVIGNLKKEHAEALKYERERRQEGYETGNGWWCFILGIIWAVAGISIVSDVIQLVKLYNFPLVWILDYLKDLTAK